MAENGTTVKWIMGILASLIVGCVLGWVGWVYCSIDNLDVKSIGNARLISSNTVDIGVLKECTLTLKSDVSEIKKDVKFLVRYMKKNS